MRMPLGGLIAVHGFEHLAIVWPGEFFLNLARQRLCIRPAPLGQQSGMHHHVVLRNVNKFLLAQPEEQFVGVVRFEHLGKSIVLATLTEALSGRKKVKIVIPKYRYCTLAQIAHKAQAG
jgi:hypothetical protein